MVCVHTYSESNYTLLRYGHLKFSKMAAGRHLEFDPTGNGAVWSAIPKKPHLEPNMKGVGWCVAPSYGHLKFSQNVWMGPEVGRSSVVSIHTYYTDLRYFSFATLGT